MSEPISHQMDVYSAWLHFARSKAEWKKLRKSTGLSLSDIGSVGVTDRFVNPKTGLVQFAVYIDVKSQTPLELIEICAHEAVHVAGLLLDHTCVPYDGHSEPLAYLTGWLTSWLWKGSNS
jgi:hypothetical protein